MQNKYSIWLVIIVPYNLSSWLYTKQSYFMLSLLIPREKGPGNIIDVYMKSLMEELNE